MGYGVETPGYWNSSNVLSWKLEGGDINSDLRDAFNVWQNNTGVTFSEVSKDIDNVTVDFKVKCGQSQCAWDRDRKILSLKADATKGTILHEIGHLLGMSHEHDRPDAREKWYDANPGPLGKETSINGAVIRESKHNLKVYGEIDLCTRQNLNKPERRLPKFMT